MTVGDRIRKVRIMRGLTQKELGELIGLGNDRIRKYEANIRMPKYETLKEIANALNIGVSSLMNTNVETLGDVKALLLALDGCVDIKLDGELDSKGKYKTDTMSLTFKHPSIQKFLKEWADMKKDIDQFKENGVSKETSEELDAAYDELALMGHNDIIVKKDTQNMSEKVQYKNK